MKKTALLTILLLSSFTVACDNTEAMPDAGGTPDAGTTPDSGPPPPPANFGDACTDSAECTGHNDASGLCLTPALFAALPARGYCSQACDTDADCDELSHCEVTPLGASVCVVSCNASGGCDAADLGCATTLGGSPDFTFASPACLPADSTATLGDACASFGDCRADDACNLDPYLAPGGMCLQLGCDTGTPTCDGGAGACVALADGSGVCLPLCTADDQCRMTEGYICVDSTGLRPGDTGFTAGVCATATNVGGTCNPTDAGTVAATCQGALAGVGTDLECAVPTGFAAPVCSPDASTATSCSAITCSSGTVCYDADTTDATNTVFCADLCNPAATTPCSATTNPGQTCTDISTDASQFACLPPAV